MTYQPLSHRARSALFTALRAVFRVLPMNEPTRDRLRSSFLRHFPAVRPLTRFGGVHTGLERRPRVRADERCIGYVEYNEEPLPDPLPAQLVAFYLPQFHTIPENDEWWGKGFTEWRNVTRALPQFEGHLQPRLPGDLGFYDLRNPQVMRDQAKLAKTYGLSAFCFYFYWFGGKTLLEEPLRNWLNDASIDFQYCLCWANENWTRRWDGRDDEVLIAQRHSPEDDLAFIEHVAAYLRDPRYLRVDGKPMLLLYRPLLLPAARATAERWRAWCRDNGIGEIHLAYVQSFERPDPRDIGFDAAVEFPPNLGGAPDITGEVLDRSPAFQGEVRDWRTMARGFRERSLPSYELWRGVNCGWDNEPRRPGRALAYVRFDPAIYASWLREAMEAVAARRRAPVFINAWNEWAEGAHLEPGLQYGHAALAWTRRAVLQAAGRPDPSAVAIVHVHYTDDLAFIVERLHAYAHLLDIVVTCPASVALQVASAFRKAGLAAEVRIHPNRGRDILPFLVESNRLLAGGYDLALKIHSKRSPHLPNGTAWGRHMIEALLAPENVERVLDCARRGTFGMAAPSTCLASADSGDANAEAVGRLLRVAGLVATPERHFFAGSMFWCRLAGLTPILGLALSESDFPEEPLPADGTLAHALERVFMASCASGGAEILALEASCEPGELPYGLGAGAAVPRR